MSWRPDSAWSCDLSDRELASVGLLTQFEVQIYSALSIALKALEGLDLNQWRNLDKTPLEQITKRALDASKAVDDALYALIEKFDASRSELLPLRHKSVHSLWGYDPEEGRAKAIYRRTHERLDPSNLDDALRLLATLTFEAKQIAYRCAELIAEGKLKAGTSSKAPRMALDGHLIQF